MGSGGIAPPFLTSAIDGAEWSASCPSRFTSMEAVPGTHWIGGWVGPRAVVDIVSREKGNRTPAGQPEQVAIPTPLSPCFYSEIQEWKGTGNEIKSSLNKTAATATAGYSHA
jgi:hypothetical protein